MDNAIIYSAGYIKDGIGSFLFIIAFIFISYFKDINQFKNLFLIIITICFIIDFSFTLNPNFHFKRIGFNIPSYLVFGGIILILFTNIIYIKNIF
jgi:hypothetical protein